MPGDAGYLARDQRARLDDLRGDPAQDVAVGWCAHVLVRLRVRLAAAELALLNGSHDASYGNLPDLARWLKEDAERLEEAVAALY